jgi:hypothetical protein
LALNAVLALTLREWEITARFTLAYHDGVPLVPSWIAAHESNPHPLLDQGIFAISHMITKLYLVLLEGIKVLEFPGPVW